MTPLTKEQAEALADRIEARAKQVRKSGVTRMTHALADWSAITLDKLATEIRDGTFIEVQHD